MVLQCTRILCICCKQTKYVTDYLIRWGFSGLGLLIYKVANPVHDIYGRSAMANQYHSIIALKAILGRYIKRKLKLS